MTNIPWEANLDSPTYWHAEMEGSYEGSFLEMAVWEEGLHFSAFVSTDRHYIEFHDQPDAREASLKALNFAKSKGWKPG